MPIWILIYSSSFSVRMAPGREKGNRVDSGFAGLSQEFNGANALPAGTKPGEAEEAEPPTNHLLFTD